MSQAEQEGRIERLGDLARLCEALDHDYRDGTLSDYYRDVEIRTDWGREQRKRGDTSGTPGRLLEAAAKELDPWGTAPELTSCRGLFEYLDDVE